MNNIKSRFVSYYEKNEVKFDISFFLAGFIFDIFTLSDVDDPISIAQQVIYLLLIGGILYLEFLNSVKPIEVGSRFLKKIWDVRQLILHFFLGSLLSVYSLFFLKSSSLFSSLLFLLFISALMILNEIKSFQKSRVDLKIGLYVICVFCFFSMLIPVILGFVGIFPFILAVSLTAGVIYGVYKLLKKQIADQNLLYKRLVAPSSTVLIVFVLFYILGWIPPVPLSVQNMGIYHMIEKNGDQYMVSHENPWWRFWHKGDQDFQAQPGDKVYFFAQIFSPGRFDDSVILHWYYKDPRAGWQSTDRIPMRVTGGRKNGYRGFSVKQNYSPGEWRISVETTDSREIGRIYFKITPIELAENRKFQLELF